jgi:hypothetical protein
MKNNLKIFTNFICACVLLGLTACGNEELESEQQLDASKEGAGTTARIAASDLKLPSGVPTSAYTLNEDAGIITFKNNTTVYFGGQANQDKVRDGFYWTVPTGVKEIIIGTGTTIYGGFRFQNVCKIRGLDYKTSRIYGTASKDWSRKIVSPIVQDGEKWQFSAISTALNASTSATYTIENLKIENARAYAITSQNTKFAINRVWIKNSRVDDFQSNSDGIGGGPGTTITNCYIDTWDDAIKLYKDGFVIKDVTIVHNRNGAPFQTGWSKKDKTTHTLENIKIISNIQGRTANQAPFSSAMPSSNDGSIDCTVKVRGKGLNMVYGTSDKYRSVGTNNTSTEKPMPIYGSRKSTAKLTLEGISFENKNASFIIKANSASQGPGTFDVKTICGSSSESSSYDCNPFGSTANGSSLTP